MGGEEWERQSTLLWVQLKAFIKFYGQCEKMKDGLETVQPNSAAVSAPFCSLAAGKEE